MHRIIAEDKAFSEALAALETAERNRDRYLEKVAVARAAYLAEQKAALDRGETHSPALEVIPEEAVKQHLDEVHFRALTAFGTALAKAVPRLLVAVEAREAELLSSVEGLSVKDLRPVAGDIGELAAARTYLQAAAKFRDATRPPARAAGPAVPVSVGEILDAALSGGTVIGRTPLEPEPDREVMPFGQIRIRRLEDEPAFDERPAGAAGN